MARLLKKMKYGDFTWPNNPTFYNADWSRRVAIHQYADWVGDETEDLGIGARVISGSGVFFGKNAYENYEMLEAEFILAGVETLVHPVLGSLKARFTKLKLKQEPLPNYVEYEFEFVEHENITVISKNPVKKKKKSTDKKKKSTDKKGYTTYVVKKDDCLWNIAIKLWGKGYGPKWPVIANANKKLLRGKPDLIYPGWKLQIPPKPKK